MKITKEDKQAFFALLDKRIETIGRDKIAAHKAKNLGKDKAMRFRWDLFYASKIRIGDGEGINGDINLYSYLNDSHIDTALKAFVLSRNF